ncbi:MAG: NAD+ synthase [Rhodothermales bacterium]|nr:NAD+ synthase [Rhodothermales bacterium]
MRLALCQLNPTVGALDANVDAILATAQQARDAGAALAVFPELAVTGYPPQDLLDRPAFLDDVERAVARLVAEAPRGLALLVGAPVRNTAPTGKRLFNAALLVDDGRIAATTFKQLLPTYDVFDEYRYFEPAPPQTVVTFRGVRLGVHLCEDMWNNREEDPYQLYAANPVDDLARQSVDVFVNLSASPFAVGRPAFREGIVRDTVAEHGVPFVLVNQVGANTELVFDGQSSVWQPDGRKAVALRPFAEDFAVWDLGNDENTANAVETSHWDVSTAAPSGDAAHPSSNDIADALPGDAPVHPSMLGADLHAARTDGRDDVDDLLDALILGVKDYFAKQPFFKKALVGLSGGIDSALTAAIACLALGGERVVGVTMPSRYSSSGSVDDSRALADAFGLEFYRVPIVPAVTAFGQMLAGTADSATDATGGDRVGDAVIPGGPTGVTEENLQARTRGVVLMAMSNAHGHLLLTTGNKSETAVGYATLYGDMAGGLAVLSDVFKTDVYKVARRVNERLGKAAIPEPTLTKPPSAELRPGQKDSDSLPPYDVLDPILRAYVEHHLDVDGIVAETGTDAETVRRMLNLVDRNEFKRWQAAPGIRVSTKAFGAGRRFPLVEGWERKA